MKRHTQLLALATIVTTIFMAGICSQSQAAQVYTFENLNNAQLLGQDNWTAKLFATAAPFAVTNGLGANTTKVANRTGSSTAIIDRQNDANWSFTPFMGNETQAYIQIDAYHLNNTNGSTVRFNLVDTSAWNGSIGSIPGTALSPWIGLHGANFEVRQGQSGPTITTASIATHATGTTTGHWLRLRLVMNFQDNTMSAFYQNLTLGETEFTAIAPMQNLAANIGNPAGWNALVLRVDGTVSGRHSDNLTVGVIPEPTGLGFCALGLVGLLAARRRR